MKTIKRSTLTLAAVAFATGMALAPVVPAQAAHAGAIGCGPNIGNPAIVQVVRHGRVILRRRCIRTSLRRQGYRRIRNLRYVVRRPGRPWLGQGRRFRRGVYVARVLAWDGYRYRVIVSPFTGRVIRREAL